MQAIRNGIIALGISACLSSAPAIAQDRVAPPTGLAPTPQNSGQQAPTAQYSAAQYSAAHAPTRRATAPDPRRVAQGGGAPGGVAHAVAHGGGAPGAVRQVAVRQHGQQRSSSGGLLGNWLGGSETDEAPQRAPRSLFERLGISGDDQPAADRAASGSHANPDWTGVPYHRPHRSAARSAAAPMTDPKDPSNRELSRGSARSARPTPTAPSATGPQIPVPPAEHAAASEARNAPAARRRTALSTSSSDATPTTSAPAYGELSATESSRRSGRRPVDPLDAYLDSASASPAASPVRADGQGPIADRGLADGPRVARRPIPPVHNAETSRRRAAATNGSGTGTSMPPSLAAAGESGSPSDQPATGSDPKATAAADRADSSRGQGAERPREARSPALTAPTASPSPADIAAEQRAEKSLAEASQEQTSRDQDRRASRRVADGDTVASDAPASPGDSRDPWRASSSRQPQLGVSARGPSESTIDSSETATSVNTQPVNVVSEIPGIRVVTTGPAEIPIQQAATYEIRVENRGSISAPGTLVRVSLPGWIGIQQKQASRGEIEQEGNDRQQQLLWQVDGLDAGSTEVLSLALSAVEARQFEVAVEWAVLPQSNVAPVHVREPKLELVIDGPDQVVYGESQAYKVRVLNPGNGNAENVVFTLSPNSKSPQSQRIGTIPAGKEAHFEVELTARDRENLQIHGLAVGAAGLESELAKSIEVIAADLEAVLSGPPLRYQDTTAAYKLEVTNRGDAACDELTAMLRLPSGVRYEGGVPDAEVAADGLSGAAASGTAVTWRIGRLAPGESTEYEFQCVMHETGEQPIAFECEGTAAGAASVEFRTTVETLADLVLAVNDPSAPAPVGEEVTYEIILRNRGSKAATDVQAIAQFSHDVEPVRVEGGEGKVAPGQAVFDAIPRIEPGEELRLSVVAKADKAGLHRFRTEVRSGETLLISEEATRYIELGGQRVSQRSGTGSDRK